MFICKKIYETGTATPELRIILHIYKIIKPNCIIYQINIKYMDKNYLINPEGEPLLNYDLVTSFQTI